jgi:glycolate oxidase iron-sulfur subunit
VCVLCGKCLEVCPLFAATGREELSPKAKFFLAQTMADHAAELSEKAAVELAAKCLTCGKCEKACPFGLCAPELMGELRATHPNIESTLWKTWVEKAPVLWPMLATLSRIVPRLTRGGYAGLLNGLKAMDSKAGIEPWLTPVSFEACGKGRKAVVFPGCVGAHVQPRWTATAKNILAGLGFDVLPQPDLACCGCTLGHAGLKDAQTQMQRTNIQAWREAGRPELISFCATCRCGLRGYASRDLGWGLGEREQWLAGLVPFSELAGRVTYDIGPDAPSRVHYHTPCHGAGGGHDENFLRSVLSERLSAKTRKNLCCGFGGALKLSAPELSDQVAKRCLDFYGARPGEQILTGCSGCVIQLRANAPAGVGVGHWLEIIT